MTRPVRVLLVEHNPGDADLMRETLESGKVLIDIPVVILTSSQAEQDVVKSYELGANCYVNKPVGLKEFQDIVKAVQDFWFTVVKLP